jgi:hypothetical protein
MVLETGLRIKMIGVFARRLRYFSFAFLFIYVWIGQSGCSEDLSKQAGQAACQCAEQQTAYRLQKIETYIKHDSTQLVRSYLIGLVDSLNRAITRCYDSVRQSAEFSSYLSDSAHYRAFNAATSPCGDRILPLVESTLNRVRQALIQRNLIQYPQAQPSKKRQDSLPLSLEPETGLENE